MLVGEVLPKLVESLLRGLVLRVVADLLAVRASTVQAVLLVRVVVPRQEHLFLSYPQIHVRTRIESAIIFLLLRDLSRPAPVILVLSTPKSKLLILVESREEGVQVFVALIIVLILDKLHQVVPHLCVDFNLFRCFLLQALEVSLLPAD